MITKSNGHQQRRWPLEIIRSHARHTEIFGDGMLRIEQVLLEISGFDCKPTYLVFESLEPP